MIAVEHGCCECLRKKSRQIFNSSLTDAMMLEGSSESDFVFFSITGDQLALRFAQAVWLDRNEIKQNFEKILAANSILDKLNPRAALEHCRVRKRYNKHFHIDS